MPPTIRHGTWEARLCPYPSHLSLHGRGELVSGRLCHILAAMDDAGRRQHHNWKPKTAIVEDEAEAARKREENRGVRAFFFFSRVNQGREPSGWRLFLCKFFYRFLSVERFGGPIPLFAGGGG
jgi:hypothetical protein